MYSLLNHSQSLEKMMHAWYENSKEVLKHSGNLGVVREHFVKEILSNILPKSVIIGSGEIIDGSGNRSGQQDIIIYQASFPVISSFTHINTYLAEGVIATIEVKTDLSSGGPEIFSAFKNQSKVLKLQKSYFELRGNKQEFEKLVDLGRIKSYVIGYSGWKKSESLLTNFSAAVTNEKWVIPNLLYQPGFCIVGNDNVIFPRSDKPELYLNEDYPFAVFLHHILKSVLLNTSGGSFTASGINAEIQYNFDSYFNFKPKLEFNKLLIGSE